MDVDHSFGSSQPQSSQPDIVLWQGSQVKNAALDSLITEAKRPVPRPRRLQTSTSWDVPIPLEVKIPTGRSRPPRSCNPRSADTSPATHNGDTTQTTDPTAVLGLIKGVAAHLNSTTPSRTATSTRTDPRRRSTATTKLSASTSRVNGEGRIERRNLAGRKGSQSLLTHGSVTSHRSLPDLADPGPSSLPDISDTLAIRASNSFSMDVDSGFYIDHEAESSRDVLDCTQDVFSLENITTTRYATPVTPYVYPGGSASAKTREVSMERTETPPPPVRAPSFHSAPESVHPSPEPSGSQTLSEGTPELVPTLVLSSSSRNNSPITVTPPSLTPQTTPLPLPTQSVSRPSQAPGRPPVLGMRRTNANAPSSFTPSQALPMRQKPFRTPFANGHAPRTKHTSLPPQTQVKVQPQLQSQPSSRQSQKLVLTSVDKPLKGKSREATLPPGASGSKGSRKTPVPSTLQSGSAPKSSAKKTINSVPLEISSDDADDDDSDVEIVEESILPSCALDGNNDARPEEDRDSSPAPADADSSFGHIPFDFEADELEEMMRPFDLPATA